MQIHVANTDSIINQLFSGGTALAGLILVFLGGLLNSYDSYDAQAKNAVKKRYQVRAWLALFGFASSLAAAVLAFLANWRATGLLIVGSTATLGISFLLLALMAWFAVSEI